MSSEMTTKLQGLLWWITSIAASVLCCSVLFVLFASYLVDMKVSVKESETRITAIEARETQILTELELIRKHALAQPATAQIPAEGSAPASTPAEGQATTPTTSATPVQTVAPVTPPVAVPATTPVTGGPSVQVPTLAPAGSASTGAPPAK